MVLRAIDIIKGTQLLYVDIVALTRKEICEKELLKPRGEILMCMMRMHGTWLMRFLFLHLFPVILAARAGPAAPAGGNAHPQAWMLWHHRVVEAAAAASQPFCRVLGPKLKGSSNFWEHFICCPLHRCPSYPLPTLSGKQWLRAFTEWVTEIELEVWKPRRKRDNVCVSLIARWLWSHLVITDKNSCEKE